MKKTKTMLLEFFVKTVRDFKDLTVTLESELECEILTTGNARCYLIVINFRKLLPNHRFPASEFYTLYVFHLSFFVYIEF